MKNYIAVVSSAAGKITKYQDFDTLAEAQAHTAIHGGFAHSTPGQNIAYITVTGEVLTYDAAGLAADEATATVLAAISSLEAAITPRRVREAVLGTDNGWLAGQEALIAIERAKL